MIAIFCNRGSEGARDLTAALNAAHPGSARRVRSPERLRPDDFIVNWGTRHQFTGVRGLNLNLTAHKLAELQTFVEAGIPTVPFSITRQAGEAWQGRRMQHTQARDLRANLRQGDYYVQIIPITHEFRFHVFNGQSIRAGEKVPRPGATADPVFRTHDTGWIMDYANRPHLRAQDREIAKRAVASLGYAFGAVDLGITTGGRAVVFEVNAAPGLEGGTIEKYADAVWQSSQ